MWFQLYSYTFLEDSCEHFKLELVAGQTLNTAMLQATAHVVIFEQK